MTEHYDVVIIGSGAGGGTLAHRLAPSGKRILILERGDCLPREPANWDATEVFVKNRYISTDTWYDDEGKAFQPQVHYNVGGATKFYGAALYRLREKDFGELQHHGGISPAWPVGYDEFEPYYTQAEELYKVHGAAWRGSHRARRRAARIRTRRSRTSPASSGSSTTSERSACTPSTRRRASTSTRRTSAFSTCVRCGTCDGFACLVQAKSDAEVVAVRPAIQHANVDPGPQRRGPAPRDRRLGSDRDGGRRGGATGSSNGSPADLVVVSAGAANSAKLLLASANDRHPHGLANGSDHVGRHYMFHNSRAFLAISHRAQRHAVPEDPRRQRLLLRRRALRASRWATSRWSASRRRRCTAARSPSSRASHPCSRSTEVAEHAVDFWLSAEDLPDPDNRVTLGSHGDIVLTLHAEQPAAAGRALQPGQGEPRAPRHAPAPPGAARPVHEERHPRRRRARTRPAPSASATTRRPPCSTATAAPTRWTTSTSSTPASSPASAR